MIAAGIRAALHPASTRTAAMAGPGQGGPRLRWTNEDVDMGDWLLPGDYDLNTVRSHADIYLYL